jgi:hypothetical protein
VIECRLRWLYCPLIINSLIEEHLHPPIQDGGPACDTPSPTRRVSEPEARQQRRSNARVHRSATYATFLSEAAARGGWARVRRAWSVAHQPVGEQDQDSLQDTVAAYKCAGTEPPPVLAVPPPGVRLDSVDLRRGRERALVDGLRRHGQMRPRLRG